MTYTSGDKYVGQWKDKKRDGQGTYTWGEGSNNGDKYVGEYKDDKRDGQGAYTFSDGRVFQGLWENNKFIGE